MNIGEAATASGISAKMIRYYEQIGMIPPAGRSEGGYRHYGETDVHGLRFIRRARDLGFSVEQITGLLALWRDTSRASGQVKALALDHVAALKRKIGDLEAMVRTLEALADHCGGDRRPDCPIIDDLAGPHDEAPRTPAADHRFATGSQPAGKPAPRLRPSAQLPR